MLFAHSSDLFFPKSPFFRQVGSFLWLLFLGFLAVSLGDEYFSNVGGTCNIYDILPYGTGILGLMH